ncbi:hypothetical protein A1O1_08102 [Capronia coronata CBS 617.96]|uniref:Uncharacterized protein n=1 Tax=Capronia coronata CBS 617.96 TaxID=1182541 RepID=W9YIB0_9EURO|nr:uncharacterized protein A1O1_08102 [Capronia coronata CBS 617.96]EXJ82034.1 hypothetical protein A1O1_08102 [Capronia coronata CBS 617.96]
MDLSPSTWRVLGLSVATSYIGLGTFAITCPDLAAKCFGIYPDSSDGSSGISHTATTPDRHKGRGTETSKNSSLPTDRDNHAAAVSTSMLLLGARDLSIGIALAWLDYQENPRTMGSVILSGLVLCVVDIYEIWRLRGPGWASIFAAGAGVWIGIGFGLVQ